MKKYVYNNKKKFDIQNNMISMYIYSNIKNKYIVIISYVCINYFIYYQKKCNISIYIVS